MDKVAAVDSLVRHQTNAQYAGEPALISDRGAAIRQFATCATVHEIHGACVSMAGGAHLQVRRT